jgi:outer membrane protein assembly factor BamB
VHGDLLFSTTAFAATTPPYDGLLKMYDKDGNGRLSLNELGTDAVSGIMATAARYRGDRDGVLTADEFVDTFGNANGGQPTTTATNIGRIVDGKVVSELQWQLPRGVPIVSTPLVLDGLLYLVANGGILTVVEANTGQIVKQGRLEGAVDAYYSSPVAADGKIFVVSELGNAVTIRAGREWEVISVSDLNDPCYATPALESGLKGGGRIYVRTDNALSCFSGG